MCPARRAHHHTLGTSAQPTCSRCPPVCTSKQPASARVERQPCGAEDVHPGNAKRSAGPCQLTTAAADEARLVSKTGGPRGADKVGTKPTLWEDGLRSRATTLDGPSSATCAHHAVLNEVKLLRLELLRADTSRAAHTERGASPRIQFREGEVGTVTERSASSGADRATPPGRHRRRGGPSEGRLVVLCVIGAVRAPRGRRARTECAASLRPMKKKMKNGFLGGRSSTLRAPRRPPSGPREEERPGFTAGPCCGVSAWPEAPRGQPAPG